MLVTRSKQGIEAEGGDRSNVSKTIVKQGLEGCLGYHANVPMTIGKTDYEEGGVATCTKKCKTADICKRKPEEILHTEKNQRDCGASPPRSDDWSGLNTTVLPSDKQVTGATTNVLRKGNQKNRHSCQEEIE